MVDNRIEMYAFMVSYKMSVLSRSDSYFLVNISTLPVAHHAMTLLNITEYT